jgi:catechol 2,3-dioxygenase-like lactoylglutathione lyase family enzyme
MGYRLGRLIDHLDLRVSDWGRSRRFYLAVFAALGRLGDVGETEDWLELDELYVTRRAPGGAAVSGLHLCFQAADRAMVERFHTEGIRAGGRDNGGPGLRDYHPGYYAAFLLDPDGNNIEAKVDERVTARSAAWVEVETG